MKKLILVVLVIGLVYGAMQVRGYNNFKTQEIDLTTSTIEIPKDTTPRAFFINELGLNENYVKAYFKLNDINPDFQAGSYKITEPLTVENFFDQLENPILDGDVDLIVIEGNTIYDIDACLASPSTMQSSNGGKTGCVFDRSGDDEVIISDSFANAGEFIAYAQSPATVAALQADYDFLAGAQTLEGFLHPDSYKINKNTFSVESLVVKMLDNFENKVMQDEDLISEFGNTLAQEVADNIILASVVEKEIASPETREIDEAEKVAGVLKKRFNEGWQIGADATVCYPYAILSKDCTPSFVLQKLYDVTEYNTRQMVGLPKTPISNPFAGTIKSTLLSTESNDYFYLHAPNGKIYYAETNAGHEANKALYLR